MSTASESWFLRSRGRVLGPFTRQQLESLRDRGQLSQFHEISQDRACWMMASGVEWLFAATSAAAGAAGNEIPLAPMAASRPATPEWYYSEAGATLGPMNAEQITALVATGRIRGQTPVWRTGYASWVPLRDVPELASHLNRPGPAGGIPAPSASPGASQAAGEPAALSAPSRRTGAIAAIAGGLVTLTLLGVVGFLLIERSRRDPASNTITIPAPAVAAAAAADYVDSHTSPRIAGATGLVVAGATVTNLKTGEQIELPGSRGTCFAIDPKGYLLTNKHVVEEHVKLTRADAMIRELETTKSMKIQPHLWVYFARERFEARVIYTGAKLDVAVLKVERNGPCFHLADGRDAVQGTHIYALGFPAAASQNLSVEGAIQKSMRKVSENVESVLDEADFRYSITDGIVSLLRKEVGIEYIQHSAEISGGNSGGPLIYEDGTVLGINTLVTFDQNRPGVGIKYYAISIKQAVDELRGRVPELFPR